MKALIVGVGDCRVSDAAEDVLVTYALGSCVAVAIYDPMVRVGGILHYMLPQSEIDPVKASQKPYMFADTGIPLLFRQAYERGAEKRRLIVRVAGGAQVMDAEGVFNIGKRNYVAMRKIFWKAGILIQGEAVGGNTSRTMRLEIGTGRLWLREAKGLDLEMPGPALRGADQWRSGY